MVLQAPDGYLRSPSIGGDTIVFVTEDDLWSVPAEGGQARRVTADLLRLANPVISPDARAVAFTSAAQGQADLYVLPLPGGMARRVTWSGAGSSAGAYANPKALSWTPDGRVAFASDAGQPFASLTMAYAVAEDGQQPPDPLPYGPVRDASYGPGGGVVIGRNTADPATWKRYRGGTAGAIWIDREGDGDFELLLRPESVDGNLASPMWLGSRVFFLSDHEGIGNLYSCSLQGDDITRHTDHDDHYARLAKSDGSRIVYQVAARLWLYDPASDRTREVQVELGSPRTQRQPRFVAADRYLSDYQPDWTAKRLVVSTRGKLFTFAPFDGPVVQHGASQGVRYRLSSFLGQGTGIVTVSDASGFDAIEVHRASAGPDNGSERNTIDVLDIDGLGRVLELVPSPDGSLLAVTNHKFQLFVVDAASGERRLEDESAFGRISGPTWSPDGKWLAYSYAASAQTRQIKLGNAGSGEKAAVTGAEFRDTCPSFDPTGKYLYFLSQRTFDPVYDSLFFDLGFPLGARPYLVTLQADAPSPFVVPPEPEEPSPEGSPSRRDNGAAEAAAGPAPEPVPPVELEGIGQRVVEVPVPEARYEAIFALKDKLLLFSRPVQGSLERVFWDAGPPANGVLESYDLVEARRDTLLTDLADVAISGDRGHLAYRSSGPGGEGLRLRVVASSTKPDEERAKEPPGRRSGFVDLSRIRVLVDPGAEWAQMLREAWRLQLDHFWTADLSGVDWQTVLDRYLPLVELVATRSELSDLIWEVQGELGTSHSYELGGEYRKSPPWGLAQLGADLAKDASGRWVVTRVAEGSSWAPKEASPLSAPGVDVGAGTAITAVNGQAVDPGTGLGPLLANQAGLPVELTVEGPTEPGAAEAGPRTVVVQTLSDEHPLRYRDWVVRNREKVRQASDGRVGYIHIPDMGPWGWSEFHRSYLAEVERDALVVDVRFNGGGHVSALILEKLVRHRIGWAVPRRGAPISYPEETPRGPLVAITNEYAGSDGDIFTHGFKLLRLGPVIGTRTWGGVIGIDINQVLVDGSITTQPEYAFWFEDVGWGVENYGSDPDEEILFRPQDYATGRDPQLARAVELALTALAQYRPALPELDRRPQKALPVLPARR
ncbi:MAG TPA: S41 family peptidase [Acidimicrobiales bacterium]|nr:S41 family peptidase [Acidimicrobiales bacterium]